MLENWATFFFSHNILATTSSISTLLSSVKEAPLPSAFSLSLYPFLPPCNTLRTTWLYPLSPTTGLVLLSSSLNAFHR